MNKPGHSLPELMVTLTLFGLLSVAAASVFRTHTRLAQMAIERAQVADALRTAALVLGSETRWLNGERDLLGLSRDSLAIRAFRGTAVVCGRAGTNSVLVRYSGLREPNAHKDSLLVLSGDSLEQVASLVSAQPAAGTCQVSGTESLWRWTLDRTIPERAVLLLFEAGTYYLSDHALRYRLGAEGRQPITTERFDDRRSGFDRHSPSDRLRLDALVSAKLQGESTEWNEVRVRLSMLNGGR